MADVFLDELLDGVTEFLAEMVAGVTGEDAAEISPFLIFLELAEHLVFGLSAPDDFVDGVDDLVGVVRGRTEEPEVVHGFRLDGDISLGLEGGYLFYLGVEDLPAEEIAVREMVLVEIFNLVMIEVIEESGEGA